jgi:hypothetical protein
MRTFTSIALQGTQGLLQTRYYIGQQIHSQLAKEQSADTQHIPHIPHANSTQAPGETPLPTNELEVHVHKLLNRNRNGPDLRERTERLNARRAKHSYELWLTIDEEAERITAENKDQRLIRYQQASKHERRELANTARIQCGQPLLPNIPPASPRTSSNQPSSPIVRDTSNPPVVQPISHRHPPLHAKPADTSHDDDACLQAGKVIILDIGTTPTQRDPQYI